MDVKNWRPPDESNSNKNPTQDDELVLNGIEIKPEPTIKLEYENTADIVNVPATECGASGSAVIPIGGGQTGVTYDFNDVCDLNERTGRDTIGLPMPNDARNLRSKKRQSKPKSSSLGIKKTKKFVAKAKNTRNESTRNNKKKTTSSKRMCKQHRCSSCDYTTSNKGHLNKHIRKHTGEKPFACSHCAKRYTQKQNLQSHMRMHVDEFLFSCSNCLKGFSQETEKLKHETICKIRRYKCHLCIYSTLNTTHFVQHVRIHTGIKPFHCEICQKSFAQNSNLKTHVNRYHK